MKRRSWREGKWLDLGNTDRTAYFWEAAARNAWLLGILGSALNFIIVLGRESGGIESIADRMIRAFVVGLYGLVIAVICLIPTLKIRGWAERDGAAGSPEARGPASAAFGKMPVPGRVLGYALFAVVLVTAGYSLLRGRTQSGVLSIEKVLLHWPSILVVFGGTIALAVFMGTGAGARALTLGFGMTGLICLLMGFIQALFGFVHHSIQGVASAIVFIISSSTFALLGMVVVGAPLEDREVMEGRRDRPGPISRMFWVVFPLVAFIFLILAFLMIVTPMTKPPGR